MDPLITYRLDPAMRVMEKPSGEYEPPPRRRRTAPPAKPAVEEAGTEDSTELTAHQIDDLA